MNRCICVGLLSVILLAVPAARTEGAVFAGPSHPPTWRREAAVSPLILFGTLDYPREGSRGTSNTLIIERVLKSHPLIAGRKKLSLHRDLPVEDLCRPPRYLIFVDVYKGKIEPYRGVKIGEAGAAYLKGLMALDGRDRTQVLRYCFDFLDHPEKEVADDAAREFAEATAKEVAQAARHFSRRTLRRRLLDDKTSPDRLCLYSRFLGLAGRARDAELLRQVADQLAARGGAPIDPLLAQARLDPTKGLALLHKYLRDRNRPFGPRFAALKALDYILDERPDLLNKKELLASLMPLLDDPNLAHRAIDCLRHRQLWDQTPKLLALYRGQARDTPHVRLAIVCFALRCPRESAVCFIQEVDRKDPDEILAAKNELDWEEVEWRYKP